MPWASTSTTSASTIRLRQSTWRNELTKRYGAPFEPRARSSPAHRGLLEQVHAQLFRDTRGPRASPSGHCSSSACRALAPPLPSRSWPRTRRCLAAARSLLERHLTRPGEAGLAGQAADAAGAGQTRRYLAHERAGAAAARIMDKMPANFIYAGLIHAALPQARSSTCSATRSIPACRCTSRTSSTSARRRTT